jgi:high-affinity iron transporter
MQVVVYVATLAAIVAATKYFAARPPSPAVRAPAE